jgi:hypothetical protein
MATPQNTGRAPRHHVELYVHLPAAERRNGWSRAAVRAN